MVAQEFVKVLAALDPQAGAGCDLDELLHWLPAHRPRTTKVALSLVCHLSVLTSQAIQDRALRVAARES